MTTNEKICALRTAMQAAGVDAYYLPTSDAHMSEYLPEHWQSRAWMSGFTGSAGTLVVTQSESALWTDGRYFIQAAKELAGSEIQLMKMAQPGVPTVAEFLADQLPHSGVLGMDGNVTADAAVQEFVQKCAAKSVTVKDVDLIAPLWQGRPAVPASEVFVHEGDYAGKSAGEKLADLRLAMQKEGASAFLVCRLDSAVWLLNIRATDISYNPFALCYVFVSATQAVLFINTARVPAAVRSMLEQNGVELQEYSDVTKYLASYAQQETLLLNGATTNYALALAAKGNAHLTVKEGEDPIQMLKGVKSDHEIACLKQSHAKDGVAMVRFQMRLEAALAAGETVTELMVADWLKELRLAQPLCIGESFNTIAAYGANAAMMHYAATPKSHATLQTKGYLLVDSGAQFLDGTTDITRTYALGALTQEEKRNYTLVLKSHIGLASAVFLEGCSGANLDIMARSPMWKHGLDYRCGTGHGVGFLGGVHEGPHSMRTTNYVKILQGMTVTDEPGYYEEGVMGIRIENELVCVKKMETEYGNFLGFEPFTYCPIDTTPVLVELLQDDELQWLNAYHVLVQTVLVPLLSAEEAAWLATKTAPLTR